MWRNIVAVFTGLLAGSAFNMALIQLNSHVLFPARAGLDMNDPVQFNSYIDSLPTQAFIMVLVAHLGQAFIGGWIAARLGAERPMIRAMIIGVLSLAGGIMAMLMIDGPAWLSIELPLYLIVAWLAGHLEVKRRQTPSP